MFLIITMWILFGAAAAYYGQIKGRDPILWFVLGALFGAFSLIVLFFLPSLEPKPVPAEAELVVDEPAAPLSPRFRDWFYMEGSVQQGPITYTVLQRRLFDGKINGDTLVWSEGMEGWSKIEDVEDLKDLISNGS
ncbi:MAG: DUF4339 domain-containing protein [Parachlamydiaceae bacterium]